MRYYCYYADKNTESPFITIIMNLLAPVVSWYMYETEHPKIILHMMKKSVPIYILSTGIA